MLPLTLLAATKLSNLLTANDALSQVITMFAEQFGATVAPINSSQVVLSSVGPEMGDKDLKLTYPRICIYASQLKNSQREKFRSFSGSVAVTSEIWSSTNLMGDADQGIHYYIEAVTSILRANMGDWGDGMRFSGAYEVQLQAPKVGGFGFIEAARIVCSLDISLS